MKRRTSTPNSVATGKSLGSAHGCRPRIAIQGSTIADLIDEYEKSQQASEKGWNPLRSLMEGYRRRDDLESAVKSAALAEDLTGESYGILSDVKSKRHGHQRRIKRAALEQAERALSAEAVIEKLGSSKSFDEVFGLVCRNCSQIQGLGPLYIYDTSLRIGAFLRKLPTRVHLQAGALAGARALGIDVENSPLPVSKFPAAMQRLAAHEIEDFLCIYKGQLAEAEI